LTFMWNKLPY